MSSSNQRAFLVTGGAGFIGSHLCDELLRRGDLVVAIDDLSTGRASNLTDCNRHSGFTFVEGSVLDQALLRRWSKRCDGIFHLAAAVGVELVVRNPTAAIETNILGTHCVLEAAAASQTKVVLASTSEVYGKSPDVPFREDGDQLLGSTQTPRWSYAASKAIDEYLALHASSSGLFPAAIARLFNVVGPRQVGRYGMVLPRFVSQALRGDRLTVHGDGQQRRCFCDVGDVVTALTLMMDQETANGEVFNVGSDREISILELAELVTQLVAEKGGGTPSSEVRLVPYEEVYGPDFEDMRRRLPDISKVRSRLGWQPGTPLEQTIGRVIDEHVARFAEGNALVSSVVSSRG